MAREAIRANYTISEKKVTQAMVNEAQKLLDHLSMNNGCSTVLFNDSLLMLFRVIPRKMGEVSSYLARSEIDFPRIIQREQDLLDVMRGQVYRRPEVSQSHENAVKNPAYTILDAMGLSMTDVTPDDVSRIKNNLGSISGKFKRAWRVTNVLTQGRFDAFMSKAGDIEKKLLWHGSRNENWWSIIQTGLMLRPTNAVITGKMFGNGVYFAPKAHKSLGYTSLSGSYWARGEADTGFMALYEVAYGTAYDVYAFENYFHGFDYAALQ